MYNLNKFIKYAILLIFLVLGLKAVGPAPALASEPFIGEVRIFAGNFAPRGWAFCDGQLLQISQNTALFSILGTTYGGDGRTTLGLPDLRGRAPMHPGNGPGLTSRQLGERGGTETVVLSIAQIPTHNHAIEARGSSAAGDSASPTNKTWAVTSDGGSDYATPPIDAADQVQMSTNAVRLGAMGSNQAHDNMPPFQVLNYIIALQGIYPSRN